MKLPVLHVRDIPDEGVVIDRPLDPAWLADALADSEYAPQPGRSGRARLRADRQDEAVVLSGQVEAPMIAECVRCLADVPVTVATEFTLNLEPAPTSLAHGGETELTSDELDVDYYTDGKVDIGQWVREQLLLEAPSFPHCEPACAEPLVQPDAPAPSTSDTVDPRLAPLKKFLTKE